MEKTKQEKLLEFITNLIQEQGSHIEPQCFFEYCDNHHLNQNEDNLEYELKNCEEAFLGNYDSVEAYAEQYIEDTGMLNDMPHTLKAYFDVKAFARDMVLGGDVWISDSGNVFNANI
jgi:antirestriction protein